ncbi:MAG TPA: hypothetical protein PKY81_13570 [bacterium]|nr:hypothetical protein [bacterium]HPN31978.1 hypothetical protein [bacterium]
MKKIIPVIFFLILISEIPSYSKNYYQLFAYTKSEVLGRGGVCVGVPSKISFYGFNPASFSNSNKEILYGEGFNISFDLFRSAKEYPKELARYSELNDDFEKSNDSKDKENENGAYSETLELIFVPALISLVKSVKEGKIFQDNFYVGTNLFENLSSTDKNQNYIGLENHYHSLVLGFMPLKNLTVGYELNYIHTKSGTANTVSDNSGNGDGFGSIIGLFVMPATGLGAGLTYVDYSSDIKKSRIFLDRVIDQSINLGVSYHPGNFLFGYDIKNINNRKNQAYMESHFGISYVINLFRQINADLHLGYYKNNDDNSRNYAYGFSIYKTNVNADNKRSGFSLGFSNLIEKEKSSTSNHFLISLSLTKLFF